MDSIFASLSAAEAGSVLKAGIRFVHLLGIVLGLGAATLLDLIVIRFLIVGRVSREHADIVDFASGVVVAGLALLWISGVLFLLHYAAFDPGMLTNQKVWAKIAIVGILTVNGYYIHRIVLPLVRSQIGTRLLLGVSPGDRALVLTFGAVSAISWYIPLLLGAFPHFNFVVPATNILAAYVMILLLAVALIQRLAQAILSLEPSTDEGGPD